MFKRLILKGIGLGLLGLTLALPQAGFAVSIGIKLGSNETGSSMAAADVAGAPGFTQANWNNTTGGTGSLAAGAVKDNTGATVTNMSFAWESSGTYRALDGSSAAPNDKLNAGFLWSATGSARYFTFTNVPMQVYDVVVYFANDATGRFSRIQVNGSVSHYVRNVQWPRANANMGAYAQSPFYGTQAAANADATGYSYLVFRGVTGATCSILHQAYNGNDGICAVQIVPPLNPLAISISATTTTVALGAKLVVMGEVLYEGAAPTITRMDLKVDNVLVQSKTSPVVGNSWEMEWFAGQGLQGTGRPTNISLVATTSLNTSFTAARTFNVVYDYKPYVVTPTVTLPTSTTVNALNLASWATEEAWRAFDGVINNVAGMNTDNSTSGLARGWWGINCGSAKSINSYQFTHWRYATANQQALRVFKDWVLQGSANGATWTDLDTVTSMPLSGLQTRNLATPVSYQHFRLLVKGLWDVPPVSAAKSGYVETSEIQYLSLPALLDITAPATPITNAAMGQKITVSAKTTLSTGKTVASVRFYSGVRFLGFGEDKGGGVYSLDIIADRMGDIPVYGQLVLTDGFVVNSANSAAIKVTAVPVEMSHFAAE